MNIFLSFLLFFFLNIRSILTVNPNKNGSFLSTLTAEVNTTEQETNDPDFNLNKNEREHKRGKNGVLESIQNLFRNEDKTGSKTHNNVLVLDFEGFKNVRGKKEVENTHIQVQKSSNLFTNNTEKGILHFKTTKNKLNNKGNVVKATFKIKKLFDAKNMGFKCPSNAVKLYLISEMGSDMKINILKGPIKLEFKKNELEVDVTKFFDDIQDHNLPPGPSLLQFTDLTPENSNSDDDLVFDVEGSGNKNNSNNEDELFGNEDGTNDDENGTPGPDVDVDKYFMIEAEPNCYFGFDVDEHKPKVRLEMTKKTTFTVKGTVKKGAVGIGVASVVALLGLGIYLLKRNNNCSYTIYDGFQNDLIQGGQVC